MNAPAMFLVQLVEANHVENEFFTLGGAGFTTERDRATNFAAISRDLTGHDCVTADRCYLVELLAPHDGFTVDDALEVSEATAHALLGVDDFEPLRQAERRTFTAAFEASR